MSDERFGFADFGDRVWINCSHQGPLPLVAAEEAREAVDWKLEPWEMTQERFDAVPRRLKENLAHIVGGEPSEIVLANGASYGVHLLANGIPLARGDEVLLMRGDFPSNLMPWLGLEKRGVVVRILEPEERVLTAAEIRPHLSERTRVLCMSWVHSLSGYRADLDAIGSLCREHDVRFLVNTSQGLGARRLDVSRTPVDAITNVGWKWLCGPYATGFLWLRPELLTELDYNQSYWLALLTAEDLGREDLEIRVPEEAGASRYDVFSPANFFNFKAWSAALEHLVAIGLDRIEERDEMLVAKLLAGLDRSRYEVTSPEDEERISTLVFLSHRDKSRNREIYDGLLAERIHISFRFGALRLTPHFYNTEADIERALEALDRLGH